MAKKVRVTQEAEIIKVLKKEGLKKITGNKIKAEPCKSIAKMPHCFKKPKEPAHL